MRDRSCTRAKLVTEDQTRMLFRELLEVERGNFSVLHANFEAHRHMGSCPGYALLILHGTATKSRKDGFRERIGRIMERTLAAENFGRRSRDGNVQGSNRWEKASSREEKRSK